MNKKSSLTSFTLVELLVVIAIISILAGMLMPALEKSLEAARTTSCLSNQKQIGLIYNFYETDSDDFIIPFRTKVGDTVEYLSLIVDAGYLDVSNTDSGKSGTGDVTVFICPSGNDVRGYGSIANTYDESGRDFWRSTSPKTGLVADSHYALNATTWDKVYPMIEQPISSSTGTLIKTKVSSLTYPGKLVRQLDGFWGNFIYTTKRLNARHNDSTATCVLKFDGSAEASGMEDIPTTFSNPWYMNNTYPRFNWRLDQ